MEVERFIEMLDSMMAQAFDGDCGVCFNDGFSVNRIYLDDDGDVCLVSNEMDLQELDASEIKAAIEDLEDDTHVYFVIYDDWHDGTYFKIKSSWEFNSNDDAEVETVEIENN